MKLLIALVILGIIARTREHRSEESLFFAQHKWTLRDAYGILIFLIAVQFLDVVIAVWLQAMPPTPAVVVISGASIVIPLIITYCLYRINIRRHYGININLFGINKTKILKRGVGSANIVIIFFALLGAYREIPPLSPGASEWPIGFWLTVIVLGFLGPAAEELLFRGILYAPVARRAGKWKAIMALSLVECLMHTNFGLAESVPQFLFWVLLYYIYVRNESLFVPIILHIGFNALSLFWYRKAVEKGVKGAKANLGMVYVEGSGVPQDIERGVALVKESAEEDAMSGQLYLGLLYEYGAGVEQDITKALELYRKSAEQGDLYGQRQLGRMYRQGIGVPKDIREAVKWYKKAAEQGDQESEEALKQMKEESGLE